MRPPAADVPAGGRVRTALAGAAVLVGAADTYVVVLALPDMMAGVGIPLDQLQRGAPIVTAFLLGYVLVLPLAGRVSDVLGRVPVLVACLLAFALGSLVTASAESLAVAVAGRALQGLGAGGLVPPTLALVADLWPPARRGVPLGAVGAAQELGAVLGPLVGALIVSLSGWRAIFWCNLAVALLLAAALLLHRGGTPAAAGRGPARGRVALAGVAALLGVVGSAGLSLVLHPPAWLATDVTLGAALVPLVASAGWTSPLALGVAVLLAAALLAAWRAAGAAGRRPQVDVLGAVFLGIALTGVVLTFAGAETTRTVVDDRWPLLVGLGAAGALAFAVRQRTARAPLVPHGALREGAARGAVGVNVLVGVALVAVLVDVPVFARVTRYPDSQLGAALVLVQFLAALPVGALLGGWATRRIPPERIAATGMAAAAAGLAAMATWSADALDGPGSSAVLVLAGLGFGLAVAPVNAVLLAATPAPVHGLASALAVLARTVGMLVGLSALTAVGLRVFFARQEQVGSPFTLCPQNPADCPAYVAATQASVLGELHAIFAGAAGTAAVAAVLCLVLLRRRPPAAAPVPAPARSSRAA